VLSLSPIADGGGDIGGDACSFSSILASDVSIDGNGGGCSVAGDACWGMPDLTQLEFEAPQDIFSVVGSLDLMQEEAQAGGIGEDDEDEKADEFRLFKRLK
jgi:hypothetical protein